VGRPSDFKPEYCEQTRKLCLLGYTDAELGEFFGKCEATINNWKIDHPEFLESIRAGKALPDAEVANSLYNRARGAEWFEDVPMKVKEITYGENGCKTSEVEKIVVTKVLRAAPPDTQAASLYLRNRRPKNWREKVDHQTLGKDGQPAGVMFVDSIPKD